MGATVCTLGRHCNNKYIKGKTIRKDKQKITTVVHDPLHVFMQIHVHVWLQVLSSIIISRVKATDIQLNGPYMG